MKRIAVIGSRSFSDYTLMKSVLDKLISANQVVIVSGGAQGADTLAERYAARCGFACKVWRANWKNNGRRAGFVRNAEIIGDCDEVVAFWDDQSRGTRHSIELAVDSGKVVYIVHYLDVQNGRPMLEMRNGAKRCLINE